MTNTLSCPRCGAPGNGKSCPTCALARDRDEAQRQERYLTFVIADVLDSPDPVAALHRWQAKSAARTRLLGAANQRVVSNDDVVADDNTNTADAATAVEANAIDAAAAVGTDDGSAALQEVQATKAALWAVDDKTLPEGLAPPPETTTAAKTTATKTTATKTTATKTATSARPTPRPEPQRRVNPPPPPRRVLSPAEARAQFERRLEIGGWFTGAVFAVGGSLWATNLFWSDIPEALRPVVVGGGLAAFAAAFMALGAVLAARHTDSLAGHVLGLVGRLIGVSATIPLALLAKANLPMAVVTDGVVLVSLWAALRFVHRRRARLASTSDGDSSTTTPVGTWYFLGGFALAALGPTTPWLGVPVAIAAILLARAAIAGGTLDALAGRQTWVDDLSILSVFAAAIISALVGSESGLDHHVFSALWSVTIVAGVELAVRLIEQRPGLYGLRLVARWVLVLFALGTAASLVDDVDRVGPLLPAMAMLFVAASFFDVSRLGLPRVFSLIGMVATAWAAAMMTDILPLSGDLKHAAELWAGLGALLWLTRHFRRDTMTGGEQVATLILWCTASGLAGSRADDGFIAIPALVVAALLWLTDRRAERSPLFNLVALPAALAPLMVMVHEIFRKHDRMPAAAVVLCLVALGLHLLQRRQPTWPLTAMTTAAAVWIMIVGGSGAVAAGNHTSAMVVATAAALTLLVLMEVSRQADLGVVGGGIVVVLAGWLLHGPLDDPRLHITIAFVAPLMALLTWLPMPLVAPPVRVLTSRWARLGRARFARPWSLSLVTTILVVLLLVVRLPMMLDETADLAVATSLAVLLAAALLLVKQPSPFQWGLMLVSVLVAGADVGIWASVGANKLTSMGLGAAIAATLVAVAAVVARMRDIGLPVMQRRYRRRREPIAATGSWWMIALVGAIVADTFAMAGAVALDDDSAVLVSLALVAALVAVHGVVLFAGRAVQGLATTSVLASATAALCLAGEALVQKSDTRTLVFALVAVAVGVVGLMLARALYRRRDVPAVLAAWPTAAALRGPSLVILTGLAIGVAIIGQAFNLDHAVDMATTYGPGIIIVGACLIVGALVALRTRRTFEVAIVGGAIMGAVGSGIDGVVHAAKWAPKSFGLNEGFVAIALVGVLLLLERARGRGALTRLGFGWPAAARRRLVQVLLVLVPVMAVFASLMAVREAPRAHELAVLVAGVALVALAVAHPRTATARLGAIGVVVVGAGAAAAVARLAFDETTVLAGDGLPVIMLGGLLGVVLVQLGARRFWASDWLESFHAARVAADPDLLEDVARTMRRAVENQSLLLLAVVVAVSIGDSHPASHALLSTWLAMGLFILVSSTMAVDREQTWPAALGQGMALAIYIDIRRRTPWLDDVGGIDAIALLVGAAVFVAISAASRRQPRGASTARAAEMYAVTLPVIAAGFGDSDAGRALICLMGGGLYAVMSRTRRQAPYEIAAGVALVAAATLALAAQGVHDASLYLLPVAFVGTFLGRRHRRVLGPIGRYLAVWCHVPLYCASAWSALQTGTFGAFALGIIFVTVGVFYAMKVRDRRALYAAASAAAVLVVGRLILAGLANALLGTLLLAGAGILVLGAMTVFTIRRDAAAGAVKRATSGLDDWD